MVAGRQIGVFAAAVTLALVAAGARPALGQSCPGDCGGDRTVAIDDLVKVVGIILGAQPPSICQAADANGDHTVAVSDAIAAVGAALNGCPALVREPASALVALARGLAHLPRLAGTIAVGLDAIGESEPEMCELGGTLQSTCEDSGTGTFLTAGRADHCRVATTEGPIDLNGIVDIVATGQCPDVLFPTNVRLTFRGNAVLEGEDGSPLIDQRLEATVTLIRLLFGEAPCSIKGGEASVVGAVIYRTSGDHGVTLGFSGTNNLTEFVGLNPMGCEPVLVRSTLNGPLGITDTYGRQLFAFPAALHEVVVEVNLADSQLTIGGQIDSACLGGTVTLQTLEPLDYHPDRPCFSTGILAVTHGDVTAQVAMRAGGGVELDADGDGSFETTYASCLDLPRAACE